MNMFLAIDMMTVSRPLLPAIPGNHGPNTEERHSYCTKGIVMLKLGRMCKQTGERGSFVDPTILMPLERSHSSRVRSL